MTVATPSGAAHECVTLAGAACRQTGHFQARGSLQSRRTFNVRHAHLRNGAKFWCRSSLPM